MVIRRTHTRNIGENCFTFRLVRSERTCLKVRQRTLLNLGGHFDVAQSDWPMLCRRIDECFVGQFPLPPDWPLTLESHAQRLAPQLLAHERAGASSSPASRGRALQHIADESGTKRGPILPSGSLTSPAWRSTSFQRSATISLRRHPVSISNRIAAAA